MPVGMAIDVLVGVRRRPVIRNEIIDINEIKCHATTMASITVRKLDDEIKERLRVRAAQAGHSMEEEARSILIRALGGATGPEFLARARRIFGPEHGVELEIPRRESARPLIDFS
jgi:plasmid stability protein